MTTQITVGGTVVDVELKNIKNVHLSVHPPTGRVRIAAPTRMSLDTIRLYAIAKLEWIKKHQTKLRAQERETPREYLDRESHYVWGRRYLLKVKEEDSSPTVELQHQQLILTVRPGADLAKRAAVVEDWYREQLRLAALPLIAKWEPLLGVQAQHLFVQRMKTKWGSCNPRRRSIRLNSELAKKPVDCLEYVIVHELAHLLEPSHNARFVALMDRFMPKWQFHQQTLNRLPVRHVEWTY